MSTNVFIKCPTTLFARDGTPLWVKTNHKMYVSLDTSRLPPEIQYWKVVRSSAGSQCQEHNSFGSVDEELLVHKAVVGTGHVSKLNKQPACIEFAFYGASEDDLIAQGNISVVVITQSGDFVRSQQGQYNSDYWLSLSIDTFSSPRRSMDEVAPSPHSEAESGDMNMSYPSYQGGYISPEESYNMRGPSEEQMWGMYFDSQCMSGGHLVDSVQPQMSQKVEYEVQNHLFAMHSLCMNTANLVINNTSMSEADQLTLSVLSTVRGLLEQVSTMRCEARSSLTHVSAFNTKSFGTKINLSALKKGPEERPLSAHSLEVLFFTQEGDPITSHSRLKSSQKVVCRLRISGQAAEEGVKEAYVCLTQVQDPSLPVSNLLATDYKAEFVRIEGADVKEFVFDLPEPSEQGQHTLVLFGKTTPSKNGKLNAWSFPLREAI